MLTRREFLRRSILYTIALAGGHALVSCSQPAPTATPVPPTATALPPTLAPTATQVTPTATRVVATAAPTMTATPIAPSAGEPYLAVARGANPGAITRAAIDALGGIKKFVKPGNEVIIKPNICNAQNGPEYASTTNPDVVAELVKMCLEAGAKRVRVMDYPFSGTAAAAYAKSGIRDAVEKVGGQMEVMASSKFVPFDLPNGRSLKSTRVYQDILTADVVINVPIAKHHGSAQLTLALKGLMGVIQNRGELHLALDQRIADLNTALKPTLNVIDGVRVLMNHGPTGGNLNDVKLANTIIASHDPVAADGYAAQILFDKKPQDIRHIRISAEMGLGTYDFGKVRVKEVTV
ncbi:MAG: DUF362 domain-containing protein [Anaerolineae bacterium]|nr:DUF362 domain-containing protein [Anaerolineae bacterium]